jgi:hypothetical protein
MSCVAAKRTRKSHQRLDSAGAGAQHVLMVKDEGNVWGFVSSEATILRCVVAITVMSELPR